jgi:hypothetical protein
MPTITLPIKNYPKQDAIFSSPARIVVIKKGRRAGFTKGAANNTQLVALKRKKKKGLWVDTVNSNIERYVERFFIPSLRKLPSTAWKWQKQQKVLHIYDFYMDFRSVDNPENIEGFGYDYMILNEAGIILKDRYLWQNAIRPMMWDSDCQVFIGGTPKGGGGEFEELYNRGLDHNQPNFAAFEITAFDNPYVPNSVILEDMKSMPQRVIDQEIYGKFLDDTGIVFRGIKNVAILDPNNLPDVNRDHLYVVGADLAKLEDFTVLAVYDRANNHQVYQMRFNKLEWPYIRERIKDVSKKYNNALVMLDSTGVGEPTYDDLVRMGVPVEPIKFTNTIKKDMINKMSNWVELKNCYMLQLDDTIQEFTQFTYDISDKTDRVFYGAPAGFHDDVVISHCLAVWALQPLIQQAKAPEMSLIEWDMQTKLGGLTRQEEYEEYQESYYEEAA